MPVRPDSCPPSPNVTMMPKYIELFDTTLRDGTQGEHVTLSVRDKVRIAQRLDAFGIDVIEGGWPGSNPKDHAFFEEAHRLAWRNARILRAFGSTRRPDRAPEEDPNLRAMLAARTETFPCLARAGRCMSSPPLRTSLDENLDMISGSIRYLKSRGRRVIYDAEHFFDGYKTDREYCQATLAAAAESGADVLALCDTNGGTLRQNSRTS